MGVQAAQTLMGSQLIEDTRPIDSSELHQLSLNSPADSTGESVDPQGWGDLSDWEGLDSGNGQTIELTYRSETNDTQRPLPQEDFEYPTAVVPTGSANGDNPSADPNEINLDDLGVDALELDALLEEAAIALEAEQSTRVEVSPLNHQPAPIMTSKQSTSTFDLEMAREDDTLTSKSFEDTERLDIAQVLAQMGERQGALSSSSLSDRFEAQTEGIGSSPEAAVPPSQSVGMNFENHKIPSSSPPQRTASHQSVQRST